MVKRKVAVALSDWLLVEVDEYAERHELSRSGVIQEATAEYMTRRGSERRTEEYRERANAAAEDMDRLAREHAGTAEEPSSLEILRRLRGTSEEPG